MLNQEEQQHVWTILALGTELIKHPYDPIINPKPPKAPCSRLQTLEIL